MGPCNFGGWGKVIKFYSIVYKLKCTKYIHSSRPRKWKRKHLKSVKNDAESTEKEKGKMKKVKVQEIYPKIEIIG